MSSLLWKIGKSAKGNIYLAVSRWRGGEKVANLCLFDGGAFQTSKATKGEMNIINDLAEAFKERHAKNRSTPPTNVGIGEIKCDKLLEFYTFKIAIVDDGLINGVPVGGDGAYFVREGLAYNIDNLEA